MRAATWVIALGASFIGGAITATAQAPLQPGFDLVNASRVNVTHVIAKPESSPNWGMPVPSSAVAAGKTGYIRIASETNCLYDVRIVFADKRTEDRHKVDVCKHDRITTGQPSR
jgi:hypothetical protein